MPSLNDMLKDMPTHKNFYLRGVVNSLLPEFMDPFDSEINENNISGEALEALRIAATKIHPNLKEGELQSINYEQMMKVFGDTSIFERNYNIKTVGDELRNSLGTFGITKENGQYVIMDTYDFEPRGGIEAVKEVVNETMATGSAYPAARFIGGILMPEGPNEQAAEGALRVRIKIPNEQNVIDIDFDNDIEPDAETFVFEGPMTNKRKTLWDNFTSMFISEANAAGITSDINDGSGYSSQDTVDPPEEIDIALSPEEQLEETLELEKIHLGIK